MIAYLDVAVSIIFNLLSILVAIIAIALGFAFTFGPPSIRRDARLWGRMTLCTLRRKHKVLHEMGTIGKPGYRGLPVKQCSYCTMVLVSEADAKRFGGKRVG